MRRGALCYPRLNEVSFDPLGQPLEVAIAVEGVGPHRQMGDGGSVLESVLGNHGNVVTMEAAKPKKIIRF